MTTNRNARKKFRERAHVEAFRRLHLEFPAGALEDSEAPDFLVRLENGSTLGIEHVEWLRSADAGAGSPLREQEMLQEKVVRKAIQAYERRGGPHVIVSLFWAGLEPTRVEDLAVDLATAIAERAPRGPEEAFVAVEDTGLPDSPLPPEINRLHIYRREDLDANHWNSVRADYTPLVGRQELQQLFAEKECKVARYRLTSHELWLVVVAEGRAPSSFGDVDELRGTTFVSSFDRAFFVHLFNRTVFPLTLKRPSAHTFTS